MSGYNIGSAYGVVDIKTGAAYGNILGLNTVLGTLGGSMIGLNPITLALGAGLIGLGTTVGGLTAAIDSSVDAADRLDVILDGVQANMQISSDEVERLKNLATDLGVDPNLKVSAFEAAQAVEMLGRNGLEVQEILDGAARSTVLLANATGGTFPQSADIMTDSMALFKIEAKDTAKAVNGITSVVNNSKFSINDYALALAQGGGVAAANGVEFEDFNTAIAGIAPLFASGSDAGTSFKVFLQRLIPQSKKAAGIMEELGIITEDGSNRFFDANGNLRDMAEIAGILEVALADLSEERRNDALSTIFGTDAMRAAVGLMELGEEGFENLQAAMAETNSEMAAALRMDNLTGDLEILDGAIETLKIRIGDEWLPIWRAATQSMTGFVNDNADSVVAFFAGLADVAGNALPVLRQLADQGFGYAKETITDLFNAYQTGGLEGLMAKIMELFGQLGTYMLERGSELASDFWSWVTGAESSGPEVLTRLMNSISTFLEQNWPIIATNLDRWGELFWRWVETAATEVDRAMTPAIASLETWSNSPEAQAAMGRLGENLGMLLADSLMISLRNTERAASAMATLVGVLIGAVVSMSDDLLLTGGQITAGIFAGIISSVTGSEYRAMTIQEFRNLAQDIANTIMEFGWFDVGASIMVEILKGLTGVDLGEYTNEIGSAVSEVAQIVNPLAGAAGAVEDVSSMYDYFFSSDAAPAEPQESRSEELLEEINSKLVGQANLTIDKDKLRDDGFIHVEDYEAAY